LATKNWFATKSATKGQLNCGSMNCLQDCYEGKAFTAEKL